jgi:hypothetical protein
MTRYNRIYEQRVVLECALHSLTLIYGIAALFSVIVRMYPNSSKGVLDNNWMPFLFFGSTVIWVVLSRVVQDFTRKILYLIWVGTIILIVVWGASHEDYGGAMTTFSISVALTFIIVSFLVRTLPIKHVFVDLYVFISFTVAAGVYLLAPLIPPLKANWTNQGFIIGALVSAVLSSFYLWNIWHYVQVNQHLFKIKNTCVFAIMSPWSETVDTFAILSRYKTLT